MANMTGTSGNDSLVGTSGNDLFDGLAGNDTLQGGSGDDAYLFGRGAGRDLIVSHYDTRTTRLETLTFKAGVLPGDIQGAFVGNDLVLTIKGTTDSITIQNFRSASYSAVQQVRFTGSTTVWNRTQMITEGLRGTSSPDKLIGTSGNDTFSGSAGNDTMLGDGGDDLYYFGRGEGMDVITQDYDSRTTRLETLTFKAGVLPGDIQGAFVGNDLVLTIKGTTDSIAIQNFRSASYSPIQQVRFTGSTTVWNRTQMITEGLRGTSSPDKLIGTSGNDTFLGSAGNDTMQGDGGDDTYYFGRGEGRDLISQDYDSRVTRAETLIFKAGVLPGDIQGAFVGNDLVLTIKGTTDSIAIQNFRSASYNPVQQVRFTGSTTVWNRTQMITEALRGTSSAESLIGTAGNDTFSGSAGNDTMLGNGGDDTYYFGRGEGKDLISQDYDSRVTRAETLIFKAGVLPTEVQASLSGNNLVLAIKGTTDAITVQNFKSASYNPVQQVRFANGTSWNQATLRAMVGLPASAATAMAANQIDQLVNAMASFAAPTAAVTFASQDPLAQIRPIAVAVG